MHGIRTMLPRRVPMLLVVTAFAGLGMAGPAVAGTTFTVNDTGDFAQHTPNALPSDPYWGKCDSVHDDSCTLRAAIQAEDELGGPGTITLPAGTYTLKIPSASTNDPSTGDLDVNNVDNSTAITINGAGSGSTIINAAADDRAFAVQSNATTGGLTLSGMTIENGSPSDNSTAPLSNGNCSSSGSYSGGAIYSDGALAVTDVDFAANGVYYCGGAIYADRGTGSTLSVTNSTFNGNSAYYESYGGAVYDDSSNPASISKSLFEHNLGDYAGGAIYVDNSGGMAIDSTTFLQNTAEQWGGAIADDTSGTVAVTNSTFNLNSSEYYGGGAVYDDGSAGMSFSNTVFSGNTASGYDEDEGGGALYLDSPSAAQYTLNQDEFDNNTSNYEGGAIYWQRAPLDIHSTSFIGNITSGGDGYGGGLFSDCNCSLTLVNSTFAKNVASYYGGGIYFDTTQPAAMTNDTVAFNSAPGAGDGAVDGGGIGGASNLTASGYLAPSGDINETPGVENVVVAQNNNGDCDSKFNPASEPNGGANMDSDSTCFGGSGAGSDQAGASPSLAQPANNGGPSAGDPATGYATTLETISDAGGPAVDAGTGTGCPTTDERAVARDGDPCDIGAFEAVAAGLSVTSSAPSSAISGAAFNDTVTVSNGGPGYSTGTTLTIPVPAGETVYAATPSQGSCSLGATVSCPLGLLASGASATVTITASATNTVTNTASATNDQGASASAPATTTITRPLPPPPTPKPKVTGRLVLIGHRLHVSAGEHPHVTVRLRCASNSACNGLFSITIDVKLKHRQTVPASCVKSQFSSYSIRAHGTATISRPLQGGCVALLKAAHGKMAGKLSSYPRSGQMAVVAAVTLLL